MKVCLKKRCISGLLLCCISIVSAVSVAEVHASETLGLSNITIVWSGGADGQSAILLSQKNDEQWNEPIVLYASDQLNITPSIAVDQENKAVCVVWSSFDKGQATLYMKQYADEKWLDSEEIITELDVNVSPSVLYDDKGTIWLVWVGSDGEGDDVYYSSWNGSTFEPAERITDSSVPDVSPVLGKTAEGVVWLQWKRYAASGFMTEVASWTGEDWKTQNSLTEDVFSLTYADQDKDNDIEAEEIDLELPEYITDPDMASVFIPEQEIRSIPVKFVTK